LAGGLLVSERDYVSALATHLRFPFGSRVHNPLPTAASVPLPFYCPPITSITLPASKEQKIGCDGIIIFSTIPEPDKSEYLYKVGLLEAKWPRMSIRKNYSWDDKTHFGHSHFSHQLERQRLLASMEEIVVWEMFFSEEEVGKTSLHSPYPWGSTCIMHKQAWDYVDANPGLAPSGAGATARRWKSSDLDNLMSAGSTQSLASLIEDMASCKIGKPIVGSPPGLTLRLSPDPDMPLSRDARAIMNTNNGIINIPVLNSDNNIAAIHEFMREFGLRSYTHIPLDENAIALSIAEARKAKIAKSLESIKAD
jgi:hypothetical protein